MKLDTQTKARLARTYGFEKWQKPSSPAILSGSAVAAAQIQGYVVHSLRRQNPEKNVVLYQILWSMRDLPSPTVSSQVFEAETPAKAPDLMLYLLGQFEGPVLSPLQPRIGDVAFGTKGNLLVIFERQNLVTAVSNVSEKPVDLSGFAALLNNALKVEETAPIPRRSRRK